MQGRYIISPAWNISHYKDFVRHILPNTPLTEGDMSWVDLVFRAFTDDMLAANLRQRLRIGNINSLEEMLDRIARSALMKTWSPKALRLVPIVDLVDMFENNDSHDLALPTAVASRVDWAANSNEFTQEVRSQSEALDFISSLAERLRDMDILEPWEAEVRNIVDKEPWGLWSLEVEGPLYYLDLLGDYRIIEWEQDHLANGRYINS